MKKLVAPGVQHLPPKDQRKLSSIHRRLAALIQPLQLCLFWCRDKDSFVQNSVINVAELLQEVWDFLDRLHNSSPSNPSTGLPARLLNGDAIMDPALHTLKFDDSFSAQLDHFIQELEFACSNLNLCLTIVTSTASPTPLLPSLKFNTQNQLKASISELSGVTFSPSALLKASRRIQRMWSCGGDLILIPGTQLLLLDPASIASKFQHQQQMQPASNVLGMGSRPFSPNVLPQNFLPTQQVDDKQENEGNWRRFFFLKKELKGMGGGDATLRVSRESRDAPFSIAIENTGGLFTSSNNNVFAQNNIKINKNNDFANQYHQGGIFGNNNTNTNINNNPMMTTRMSGSSSSSSSVAQHPSFQETLSKSSMLFHPGLLSADLDFHVSSNHLANHHQHFDPDLIAHNQPHFQNPSMNNSINPNSRSQQQTQSSTSQASYANGSNKIEFNVSMAFRMHLASLSDVKDLQCVLPASLPGSNLCDGEIDVMLDPEFNLSSLRPINKATCQDHSSVSDPAVLVWAVRAEELPPNLLAEAVGGPETLTANVRNSKEVLVEERRDSSLLTLLNDQEEEEGWADAGSLLRGGGEAAKGGDEAAKLGGWITSDSSGLLDDGRCLALDALESMTGRCQRIHAEDGDSVMLPALRIKMVEGGKNESSSLIDENDNEQEMELDKTTKQNVSSASPTHVNISSVDSKLPRKDYPTLSTVIEDDGDDNEIKSDNSFGHNKSNSKLISAVNSPKTMNNPFDDNKLLSNNQSHASPREQVKDDVHVNVQPQQQITFNSVTSDAPPTTAATKKKQVQKQKDNTVHKLIHEAVKYSPTDPNRPIFLCLVLTAPLDPSIPQAFQNNDPLSICLPATPVPQMPSPPNFPPATSSSQHHNRASMSGQQVVSQTHSLEGDASVSPVSLAYLLRLAALDSLPPLSWRKRRLYLQQKAARQALSSPTASSHLNLKHPSVLPPIATPEPVTLPTNVGISEEPALEDPSNSSTTRKTLEDENLLHTYVPTAVGNSTASHIFVGANSKRNRAADDFLTESLMGNEPPHTLASDEMLAALLGDILLPRSN